MCQYLLKVSQTLAKRSSERKTGSPRNCLTILMLTGTRPQTLRSTNSKRNCGLPETAHRGFAQNCSDNKREVGGDMTGLFLPARRLTTGAFLLVLLAGSALAQLTTGTI